MKFDITVVKKSFGRCLVSHGKKKKFFDSFYDRFLDSDPEIKEKFAKTDFSKQKNALKHGISMVIAFAESNDDLAENVLKNIRTSHSKEHLNVTRRHYDIWLKCLQETLKEYDSQYDKQIAASWTILISHTVDFLTQEEEFDLEEFLSLGDLKL